MNEATKKEMLNIIDDRIEEKEDELEYYEALQEGDEDYWGKEDFIEDVTYYLRGYQAIHHFIKNQPEVDDNWIEDALQDLYVSFGLEDKKDAKSKLIKILEEAGVKVNV